MPSTIPRNHYYDDETLHALEDAVRDVWQVLKAHAPYPGWEDDEELKTEIAHRLVALADAGICDPAELRSRTLQTMPLKRRPPLTEGIWVLRPFCWFWLGV